VSLRPGCLAPNELPANRDYIEPVQTDELGHLRVIARGQHDIDVLLAEPLNDWDEEGLSRSIQTRDDVISLSGLL
jgi:hypothetical protein